jgi:hypothetical protein
MTDGGVNDSSIVVHSWWLNLLFLLVVALAITDHHQSSPSCRGYPSIGSLITLMMKINHKPSSPTTMYRRKDG